MRILLVVLASLILTGPASAIDIGPCHSIGNCISVSGQIMLGDAAKFAAATSGYPVGTFVLLSGPGGYAGEALEMGWGTEAAQAPSRPGGGLETGRKRGRPVGPLIHRVIAVTASGNLALAAMRRASSRVSILWTTARSEQ
jgi:hypothetical protein